MRSGKLEFMEAEKPAMKFVGVGVDTSVQNAGKECPKAWLEFMRRFKEVRNCVGGMRHYGVSINPDQKECTFRYLAAAEVDKFEKIPAGMEKAEVPEETYFIFTHKGKLERLGETYGKIMEIIPTTSKKQKEEFWIEVYDERWTGDNDESEFEIWIPVEKK